MTHKNAIKNNELLEKIENGTITISDIERIAEDSMPALTKYHMMINDHDIYFVDFKGYFGFSALVFKRGAHIHYANDYELHHQNKTHKQLVKIYINKLKNKIFSESQLLDEPVKNYEDFKKKDNYIRNYYPMQFESESMFFIGSDTEREKRTKYIKKNFPYFCNISFAYYNDIGAVEKIKQLSEAVTRSYNELQQDDEVFASMIRNELFNHEAGITYSASDALSSLGIRFSKLSETRKAIVKRELDYVIEKTAC